MEYNWLQRLSLYLKLLVQDFQCQRRLFVLFCADHLTPISTKFCLRCCILLIYVVRILIQRPHKPPSIVSWFVCCNIFSHFGVFVEILPNANSILIPIWMLCFVACDAWEFTNAWNITSFFFLVCVLNLEFCFCERFFFCLQFNSKIKCFIFQLQSSSITFRHSTDKTERQSKKQQQQQISIK